jgi:hypothetical protein
MTTFVPECQFDDCERPDGEPAVAVVPLVSEGPGLPEYPPYAWVMTCASCLAVWRKHNATKVVFQLSAEEPCPCGVSRPSLAYDAHKNGGHR